MASEASRLGTICNSVSHRSGKPTRMRDWRETWMGRVNKIRFGGVVHQSRLDHCHAMSTGAISPVQTSVAKGPIFFLVEILRLQNAIAE